MVEPNITAIQLKILRWIEEQGSLPEDTITAETTLIESNYLDSMDFLHLVSFMEDTFDIKFDPDLLVPENFETVQHIANLVEHLKS